MKRLIFLVLFMSAMTAQAQVISGKVTELTGRLYKTSWTHCELDIKKYSDKEMLAEVKFWGDYSQQSFTKTVHLSTKGIRGLLDKLVYDYGLVEPPFYLNNTEIVAEYMHLLAISVPAKDFYYKLIFHESIPGSFYVRNSEVICQTK